MINNSSKKTLFDQRISDKLQKYINKLEFNNHILQTQQEVSLDGILVVDGNWKMVSFNQRFIDMWKIPHRIIKTRNDKESIQTVLDKLKYPDKFLSRVKELMDNPADTSRDELELNDGRFFDRYSAPILDKKNKLRGRVWFFRDVTNIKNAKKLLQQQNKELEKRVQERTIELEKSNADLKFREEELKAHNISLRTLLHAVDNEKKHLEERISANFNNCISPLLSELRESVTSEKQTHLIDIINETILDVSSRMNLELLKNHLQFTPAELKVANLVKFGKTTKEIAIALECSSRTVDGHRTNIRNKLKLKRHQNLQTALLSLRELSQDKKASLLD